MSTPYPIRAGDVLSISWLDPHFRTSERKAARVTKRFVVLHDGTKYRRYPTQDEDALTAVGDVESWITEVNGWSVYKRWTEEDDPDEDYYIQDVYFDG